MVLRLQAFDDIMIILCTCKPSELDHSRSKADVQTAKLGFNSSGIIYFKKLEASASCIYK